MVVLAGLASADPSPKAVNIKPFRDALIILKDAEGGIYAVSNVQGESSHVFYGTGRALYEQIIEGGSSRDGTAWSLSVFAPRTSYPFMGQIAFRKDGVYQRSCGEKAEAELTQVTGDKAKAIIDKSQFLTTSFVYKPHMLARDDRGVYYYVDVLRNIYGGNGHRVFVGKKGALKQMPLVDVASDTAGDVFSTKNGDLRLVRTVEQSKEKTTAQWIRGEKKSELIFLDTYMNQPVIYRDLGIYKVPGVICGNI